MQFGAEPYDQERVVPCSPVTWELAPYHNSTQGVLDDGRAGNGFSLPCGMGGSVILCPPAAAEEALWLGKDLPLRGDLGRPGTGMPTALSNLEQL